MKMIKYQFLSCEINCGTEEKPELVPVFFNKSMPYSEANEQIAKREARGGEYVVEDDGQDQIQTPAQRIAELEEALDMLLNGVTE